MIKHEVVLKASNLKGLIPAGWWAGMSYCMHRRTSGYSDSCTFVV